MSDSEPNTQTTENIQLPSSLIALRRLHRAPDTNESLRPQIEAKLFKHLLFSDTFSEDHYNVSVDELRKIASGEIKCKVASLGIEVRSVGAYTGEINDFYDFCSTHVDFLREIPRVTFRGSDEFHDTCFPESLDNIKKAVIIVTETGIVGFVPPNVESFQMIPPEGCSLAPSPWPKSVTKLTLSNAYPRLVPLREKLEILQVHTALGLWSQYPKSLYSLIIEDSPLTNASMTIPSTLTDLSLVNCGICYLEFLLHAPNLRTLNLGRNCIQTLEDVPIPPKLEALDLMFNSIHSLEGVVFPDSLRSLCLANNPIRSMKDVKFPNLELLNISTLFPCGCCHLQDFDASSLPQSLKRVAACGQPLIDWSEFAIRPNIISLLLTIDRYSVYELSSTLECLHLQVQDPRFDIGKVRIPQSLVALILEDCTFNGNKWDLPDLESLEVVQGKGTFTVPESATMVIISLSNGSDVEGVVLGDKVEKLSVSHPMKVYPENLGSLEISNFEFEEGVQLPPHLVELKLLQNDPGKSQKVPGYWIEASNAELVITENVEIVGKAPACVRWKPKIDAPLPRHLLQGILSVEEL